MTVQPYGRIIIYVSVQFKKDFLRLGYYVIIIQLPDLAADFFFRKRFYCLYHGRNQCSAVIAPGTGIQNGKQKVNVIRHDHIVFKYNPRIMRFDLKKILFRYSTVWQKMDFRRSVFAGYDFRKNLFSVDRIKSQ